jgi:hypothetical protein
VAKEQLLGVHRAGRVDVGGDHELVKTLQEGDHVLIHTAVSHIINSRTSALHHEK